MGLLMEHIAPNLGLGPPAMAVIGMATMIGRHRCSAHRHRDAVRNDPRLQCCTASDFAVAIANDGEVVSARRRSTRSNSFAAATPCLTGIHSFMTPQHKQ